MSIFRFYSHPAKLVGFMGTMYLLTYFSSAPKRDYYSLVHPKREGEIVETAHEVLKQINAEQTAQENQSRICSGLGEGKKFDCETILNEFYTDFQKQAKAGKTEQLPSSFDATRVFARKYARETFDISKLHASGHGHH